MGLRITASVCLCLLVAELIIVAMNCFVKNREKRIRFLRSFKRGKCAVIYLIAIPLYCAGHMFAGSGFLRAFFDAVAKSVNLVVLKYSVSGIEGAMGESILYRWTVWFCFLLVGLNAIVFTLSLLGQTVSHFFDTLKAKMTSKERLILFGNTPGNLMIYQSEKNRYATIVAPFSDKECEDLYVQNISYISTSDGVSYLKEMLRAALKHKHSYVVVINTGKDEENMALCRCVVDMLHSIDDTEQDFLFCNFRVFVFGNPETDAIYGDIVSEGMGCIRYRNRYQMIATDVLDRFPLTRFMGKEQIDENTTLLRDNVEVHMFLIGFGGTNQQIFLTSVANHQFLRKGDPDPEPQPVTYYIFDRNSAEKHKNLNHSYYRFRTECADSDPKAYLPLPKQPAEEVYAHLDINDPDFYRQIRQVVTRNPADVNYAVIAFGSDLENIDMAQRLVEKRAEWGIENLVILVKSRAIRPAQTLLQERNCFFIAEEQDTIYHIDKIVSDAMSRMAMARDAEYELESRIAAHPSLSVTSQLLSEVNADVYRNWYRKKTQLERDSNRFACLSLRSKLHLMGLDYRTVGEDERKPLSEEEYERIYTENHPIATHPSETQSGKKIVSYSLVNPPSKRTYLAEQEHLRWNAFMISRGMIPATIQQILGETVTDEAGNTRYTNGKNYLVRRHGNLTTFEGLRIFRKLIAERDGLTEAQTDVIKYDYQLMDDAYWLLTQNGYEIVRRDAEN